MKEKAADGILEGAAGKHTPTPFTYEAVTIMKEDALYAVWGKRPGDDTFRDKIMVTVDPEKAAFIVRAVNSHDELVRLVKDYRELLQSDYTGTNEKNYSGGQINKVTKAIQKAMGN